MLLKQKLENNIEKKNKPKQLHTKKQRKEKNVIKTTAVTHHYSNI